MPSPVAHAAAGYAVYRGYGFMAASATSRVVTSQPWFLLATVILSVLPDLDFVPGILIGNPGRFHNTITHSLISGLVVALALASVTWLVRRDGFRPAFVLVLLCYELHVIMDFFNGGRGVMLFWPLSSARFAAPVRLFYGVRWEEGLASIHHLYSFFNEFGFIVLIGVAVTLLSRRTRFYTEEKGGVDG